MAALTLSAQLSRPELPELRLSQFLRVLLLVRGTKLMFSWHSSIPARSFRMCSKSFSERGCHPEGQHRPSPRPAPLNRYARIAFDELFMGVARYITLRLVSLYLLGNEVSNVWPYLSAASGRV